VVYDKKNHGLVLELSIRVSFKLEMRGTMLTISIRRGALEACAAGTNFKKCKRWDRTLLAWYQHGFPEVELSKNSIHPSPVDLEAPVAEDPIPSGTTSPMSGVPLDDDVMMQN